MKKLRAFVVLACVLLLGLSGCVTPRKMSSRYDTLNAIGQKNEAKGAKHAKEVKQEPTIEQILNSWKGHHISDFIRKKGPATQISPDGVGGQVYVWVETYQRSVPQIYPSQQSTTHGTTRWNPLFRQWEHESETRPSGSLLSRLGFETQTYTCRIMFYTRPDGTIYHWLID